MALIVIIVIMLIGMWIVGSLLSSITPFVAKLGTISQYNIAYYGAVMGAERGLSSLRYHDAWFQGSSSIVAGNASDKIRSATASFGRFKSDIKSEAWWSIGSRVSNIPEIGKGNVEWIYAAASSADFNALQFGESINIPLYFDDTANSDRYYTAPLAADIKNLDSVLWGNPQPILQGVIRVPEKILTELSAGGLSDGSMPDLNADIDNDSVADDVIVSWWFQGNDVVRWQQFSILPSIKQNFGYVWGGGDPVPYYEYDNGIRESIINQYFVTYTPNINTDENGAPSNQYNLGYNQFYSTLLTGNNIIPLNSSFTGTYLGQLLAQNTSELTWLMLSLSIINRMKTPDGNFIPFLEYQLNLCDDAWCSTFYTLPDPYFTLQGYARVGDYRATIDIRKPVKETTSASTFVTIF